MRPSILLAAIATCCTACSLAAQTLGATTEQTAPQNAEAQAQVTKILGLYDLQAKQGLDGFRCTANADWGAFLSQVSGAAVDNSNPVTQALNKSPMTIEDNLRTGIGDVHWDIASLPDDAKAPAQMMQDGMKQMWHGFFQAWNAFMTGEAFGGGKGASAVKFTHTSDGGLKLSAGVAGNGVEETYTDDLTLTHIDVKAPQMTTLMSPTFKTLPAGKLVTGMDSDYTLGASTTPNHLAMQVEYATIANYQIPSKLHISVKPYTFDFTLSGCTVNPPDLE